MGRIGIEPQGNITPRRKPADFPLVLVYVKRLANRLEEAKQKCRRSAKLLLVQLPTVPLTAPTW
jgi:molybdopterin-guanine dinucleotide biosynthesis protein A